MAEKGTGKASHFFLPDASTPNTPRFAGAPFPGAPLAGTETAGWGMGPAGTPVGPAMPGTIAISGTGISRSWPT